ncbi:DUF6130 family protein [Rhodocytophaga aerolata]|uniref:DUF6130 family protein n=1 Tax=Rhodocytophaga aerolata TaxID=455078 RepID=A0ABT8RDM1_9BACT|nr:DUF6130 family protein [Rhodocytophaga aerolata]MDO1450135.1 DUF6130 family protein [Rhodocytophaga aerolata]
MKTILLIAFSMVGLVFQAVSQHTTAQQIRGSESILPLPSEPPPKLLVDPPLPGPLAQGKVIIPYQTENLRIVPVFGETALDVSPRIGHLHITVDNTPWHWAHASNDQPLIIVGLLPGPHHVLVEMADASHQVIESKVISFTIPDSKQMEISQHDQH